VPYGDETDPIFFADAAAFRRWLHVNHQRRTAAWIGYHRVDSGTPSVTWSEAVDVALSFGWSDGVRRRIDNTRYMNRFTPRKPGSNWSLRNINRIRELIAEGLVEPAGLAAFEARRDDRSGVYSFEQADGGTLPPEYEAELRANAAASAFFDRQPPGYRRISIHWVLSAKQEATRQRRLRQLIADSAEGLRIALLRR